VYFYLNYTHFFNTPI